MNDEVVLLIAAVYGAVEGVGEVGRWTALAALVYITDLIAVAELTVAAEGVVRRVHTISLGVTGVERTGVLVVTALGLARRTLAAAATIGDGAGVAIGARRSLAGLDVTA